MAHKQTKKKKVLKKSNKTKLRVEEKNKTTPLHTESTHTE